MPTLNDITNFLYGQALGRTTIPSVDLAGKTIIVTGSNTGLGLECVKHLIRLNATKVIIAVRDTAKGDAAKSQILRDNSMAQPSQLEVWQVDLSSFASVTSFTQRVNTTLPRLDGFIANAGVEMSQFSLAENLEMTLTVNVVSTYLSAVGVLPKLEKTAKEYNTRTTVSIIGSLIHTFGPVEQLEISEPQSIFEALSKPDAADMATRYPLSKLLAHLCFVQFAQLVTSRSTAAGLDSGSATNAGVTANLVNPGWCASELSRHKTMSLPQNVAFSIMGRTTEQGSRTLVHGITATANHGCYLSECRVKEQSEFVRSEAGKKLGERVWTELKSLLQERCEVVIQ